MSIMPAMFPGMNIQASTGVGQQPGQLSAEAAGQDFWGALLQMMSGPMGSPGELQGTDALAGMPAPDTGLLPMPDGELPDPSQMIQQMVGMLQNAGAMTSETSDVPVELEAILGEAQATWKDAGESTDDPMASDEALANLTALVAQMMPMDNPEMPASMTPQMVEEAPAETVLPERAQTDAGKSVVADFASAELGATGRQTAGNVIEPATEVDVAASDTAQSETTSETPAGMGYGPFSPDESAMSETVTEPGKASSTRPAGSVDRAEDTRSEQPVAQARGSVQTEIADTDVRTPARNEAEDRLETRSRSSADVDSTESDPDVSRSTERERTPVSQQQDAAEDTSYTGVRTTSAGSNGTESTEIPNDRAQRGVVSAETRTPNAGTERSSGNRVEPSEAEGTQPVGADDGSPAPDSNMSGDAESGSRQRHPEQRVLEAGLNFAGLPVEEKPRPATSHRSMPDPTIYEATPAEAEDGKSAGPVDATMAVDPAQVISADGMRPAEASERPVSEEMPVIQRADQITTGDSVKVKAGTQSADAVATQSIAEAVNFRDSMDRAVRQQLLTRLTQAVRNGETEFRLKLHPESLGRVDANLSMGAESLSLVLAAETPQARQALQQGLPELRAALEQSGVQVGQCNVNLMQGENPAGQWFSDEGQRPAFGRPAASAETHSAAPAPASIVAGATASNALVDVTV